VAGQISYNPLSRTARLKPTVHLTLDTPYRATINGTAADLAGNAMGADHSWSFRTRFVDTAPPTVASTIPVDGESSVSVDTIINAVFYETVTGVDATTFRLDSAAGSEAGTVGLSPDGLTATFTHGGLASNTKYTVTLTTSIQDTWANPMASDYVWTFTTVDTVPPDAPVGLVATAISHDRIDMVWGSSSDNIGVTGYRIYRDGAAIDNTVGTSYSDTGGLTHNTLYCYEVTALDAAGNESPKSNQSCKNTLYLDTTAPDVPTNLITNAVSPFDIELVWDIPWDDVGVAGYRIYNGTGVLKGTSISNTYTDSGLEHITYYCYQVSALDAAGNESGKSLPQACEETLYNDVTAPDPPSGLTATAVSDVQMNLSWTASPYDDVGVSEYRIYRNGVPVANTPDISYYDLGLTNTTSYCYRISALDAAGNESAPTDMACDITLDPLAYQMRLVDTGQTGCYNTTGAEIGCEGTGQDGAYTGPAFDFTDNGDETITDNNTGLMWQEGLYTTMPFTQTQAATFCNTLVHPSEGYADWRLPTLDELESLVLYNGASPSIDTNYFPSTVGNYYWTTTPNIPSGTPDSSVYVIDFGNSARGFASKNSPEFYSRCVRGGSWPEANSFTDNPLRAITTGGFLT
jgi:fibronectin type 3 domain-containing protein